MFRDRKHAGDLLVQEFSEKILSFDNLLIIALPRGGVPVANEIAKKLKLPMDIFSVKKIGVPGNEELALGAVTEEGKAYYNGDIIAGFGISETELNRLTIRAQEKAMAQGRTLRGSRLKPELKSKNIILVDDGIATGATCKAAIQLLRLHGVRRVLLTVPVCSRESWNELNELVDDSYVLDIPHNFASVSRFYEHFPQVSDSEVEAILNNRIVKTSKRERSRVVL
jgi:putative phosphoribosyl transferase